MLIRRAIRKALQTLISRAQVVSHVEGSISVAVSKTQFPTLASLSEKVQEILTNLGAGTLKVLKSGETEASVWMYFTTDVLLPAYNGQQHTFMHKERLEAKVQEAEALAASQTPAETPVTEEAVSVAVAEETGTPAVEAVAEPQQRSRRGGRRQRS